MFLHTQTLELAYLLNQKKWGNVMELFMNLFSDWVGLLSLGTIVFILGMAIFFIRMFMNKSAHHE